MTRSCHHFAKYRPLTRFPDFLRALIPTRKLRASYFRARGAAEAALIFAVSHTIKTATRARNASSQDDSGYRRTVRKPEGSEHRSNIGALVVIYIRSCIGATKNPVNFTAFFSMPFRAFH